MAPPRTSFAKRVIKGAGDNKDERDRAEINLQDGVLPSPANKYWTVDPDRERKTFYEKLRDYHAAQLLEHPQAFTDANDDGSADIIDRRGDPDTGRAAREGWSSVWPPLDWAPPDGAAPGSLTVNQLPTAGQLIKRAAHPYETPLSTEDSLAFAQFREKHPDLDQIEEDPDRPAFDYAGWWKSTQAPGASGPDAGRGLEHWETPYSETFASNPDSKYTIPPPASDRVAQPAAPGTQGAAVERFTHPYKTQLKPDAEREFRQWVDVSKAPFRDAPDDDYDMRGYFQALRSGDPRATTATAPDGTTHYPDTWKTPHHRTFSDESIYAQPGAPSWHGDVLVSPKGDIVSDERGITKAPPTATAAQGFRDLAAKPDVTKLPPPREGGDK